LPPPGGVRTTVCRACSQGGLDEPIPWERRREIGWIRAFLDTTKLACFHPTRFFRTPTIEKGPVGGILYGVAAYAVGQVLLVFVHGLLALLGGGVVALAVDPTVGALLSGYGCILTGFTPLALLQAPLYACTAIVVAAGAAHATLALLKRKTASFEESLRVMGYAFAPHVWLVVPGCGGWIGYVWMLVVELKAIRETHRTGTDAAVMAVFGYRLILLLGLVALYALIVLAAFLWAPVPVPGPFAVES
jgi:hypothetical protein